MRTSWISWKKYIPMYQGLNFVEVGVSYALEGFVPPINEFAGQGRYCLPGSLLKQFFLAFSGWQNISTESVKAFLQAATDSLPHIVQKYHTIKPYRT